MISNSVRRVFISSVLMLSFAVSSCGGAHNEDSLLNYSETAERQFQEAMDEFDDEDCVTADELFQEIRRKFPYSRFAVLAELRLADCQFIQGNHAEAAVSYQQFVKVHPTHEDAGYAAYRRGLCYEEMIPGDYIVTPPPHERDQAATRDARLALAKFVADYPKSPWREQAIKLHSEMEDALVRHEIYVAQFYLNRNDRRAAAVRLEGVRINFPESSLVPDAMFMQAITFLEMNDLEEARRIFSTLVEHFPKHYQGLRAKDYLLHLDQKHVVQKRGGNG